MSPTTSAEKHYPHCHYMLDVIEAASSLKYGVGTQARHYASSETFSSLSSQELGSNGRLLSGKLLGSLPLLPLNPHQSKEDIISPAGESLLRDLVWQHHLSPSGGTVASQDCNQGLQ
jgi:hypothetical protein